MDEQIQLEPIATVPQSLPKRPARVAAAQVRPRRWPLAALLALLAGVGAESVALLVQHGSAPGAQDWRALAATLRNERKSDEPVLFAPMWSEPVGRLHLGEQIDFELLLLSDVDRHARVWEVSSRGARHPWLAGSRPARDFVFGPLRLALYEKPAQRVTFDFTRGIQHARVEKLVGSKREASEAEPNRLDEARRCTWEGKRFSCDRAARWNWVGPHIAEVGHRPYRCIYAHAVDGHVLRISFSAVPVGKTLVGYTGIDDFENRKLSKKSVTLTVKLGDRTLGTIRHDNSTPWRRFRLETAAAGERQVVHFEVTTEGAFARTFCFAAEMRE
jgi:hypothetical protein